MFEFVALTAAISAVVAARAGAEEANVKAANEAKRQYAESVRLASCPCCGSRQFQGGGQKVQHVIQHRALAGK